MFESAAALRERPFDVREAAAEFGVGLAQRLLRIDFQPARDVDQSEQQVADLACDFVPRSVRASVVELAEFVSRLAGETAERSR